MIRTLVVVMLTTISTHVAMAQTDTVTVRIKGMRCEECAHKVNTVLHKLNGVGSIDYNLERRTATIAYDKNQTCRDTIEARLAATGRYKVLFLPCWLACLAAASISTLP